MVNNSPLHGFDPLDEAISHQSSERTLFQDATRRVILNILRSYTGYFDVFSESIQNSLDAIDERRRINSSNYIPFIKITIDVASQGIRIVDNGIGMGIEQFKYCFRPNVSFKNRREGRGHKGVGATFLAYNYDHIKLQSKRDGAAFAASLAQGRHWAEELTNTVPRPTFIEAQFEVPELAGESSGTCLEIKIGSNRPNLSWIGASSAAQWLELLKLRTPLGGLYLHTPDRQTALTGEIHVIDGAGSSTKATFTTPEYLYPHALPNLHKVKSVTEIEQRIGSISGDPSQRLQKIGEEFRRLDAVYEIWSDDQIADHPVLSRNLSEDQKLLIGRHRMHIYGCFVSTAKTWTDFQGNYLKIRKSPLVLSGGLPLASDFMIQGDPYVIPLTSTIGYQNNSHVVIHLVDGNPDMGRKVFQPEIKAVTDELSRRVVDVFKSYLSLMREDTGAPGTRSSNALWQFKNNQVSFQQQNPLEVASRNGGGIPLKSTPQKEQDVVALFHELLGARIIVGYDILATSEHERYDSVFLSNLSDKHLYSPSDRLGVGDGGIGVSEPRVLEYKHDMDGLISDFEKEKKFPKDVDLLVCWDMGTDYRDSFFLKSYLYGEEGSVRQHYAATHALYKERELVLEIICLKDLVNFLKDPEAVAGEQRIKYG